MICQTQIQSKDMFNDIENTPLDQSLSSNNQQQRHIRIGQYIQTIINKLNTYESIMYLFITLVIIFMLGKVILVDQIQIRNEDFGRDNNTDHKVIKINQTNIFAIIYPFNQFKEENSQLLPRGNAGISKSLLSKAISRKEIVNLPLFSTNNITDQQKRQYQQKYSINKYQELPFCVVIPTYNNKDNDRYIKNIQSIIMQEYSNFHFVIIDDASQDGTGQLIAEYLINRNIDSSRYHMIINKQRKFAITNIRKAANQFCKPQQIMMIVDGDDELLGRQVLKLFNSVFQQKKLWFVYTNFLTNLGDIGNSRPFPQQIIAKNDYRNYQFVTSHLRAFYTQLFLNIKDEDFKDMKGQPFKAANDVSICIPILQQSHERVGYLPQITYFYNTNTGLNNHRIRLVQQRQNNRIIRKRPKYGRLPTLFEQKL